MRDPKTIGYIVVVILVAGFLIYNDIANERKITKSQYCGRVSGMAETITYGRRGRSSKKIKIYITTDDGKEVIWTTSEMQANYYKYKDYFVKISGEKAPAVFRDNRQVKGGPFYCNREINMEEWRAKINKEGGIQVDGKPVADELPPEGKDIAENPEKPAEINQNPTGNTAGAPQSGGFPVENQPNQSSSSSVAQVNNPAADSAQPAPSDQAAANVQQDSGFPGSNTGNAALSPTPTQNPLTTIQNNVDMTKNIMDADKNIRPAIQNTPAATQNTPVNTQNTQQTTYDPFNKNKYSEEDVKKLVSEADKLWKSGDKKGAVRKSEEALYIRKSIYGENHELVKQLQNQVNAAKKAAEK